MIEYSKYRYGLKLGNGFELRLSIFRLNSGACVKVRLFSRIAPDNWQALNKESCCKIRKTSRGEFTFRHVLPKEYKYLHGTLFYINDFH